MTKQIAELRKENSQQEQRITSTLSKLEHLRQELITTQKELRSSLEVISSKDAKIEELTNHCKDLDAACGASSARVKLLEESTSDMADECDRLKHAVSNLQDELKHKSSLLDSRGRMLDEANTSLLMERSRRLSAETEVQNYKTHLSQKEAQMEELHQELASIRSSFEVKNQKLSAAQVSMH